MCGIVGTINVTAGNVSSNVADLTKLLKHRGPDALNVKTMEFNGGKCEFGHTRLSIVDIADTYNQPMQYDNLLMVFNGEVYNYLELKRELVERGYQFKTKGDVEVIIKYFHCFGVQSAKNFIGMFAIALFDKKLTKLHLIRDHLGIKPLYFSKCDKDLYFASELKAVPNIEKLSANLNVKTLKYTVQYGYPNSHTVHKHIQKVPPGSVVTYDVVGEKFQKIKYMYSNKSAINPNKNIGSKPYSIEKKDLRKILEAAVVERIPGEVPFGSFLSGGIDSSLVTCILASNVKNVKTYTVGFEDENLDETTESRKIADHLKTDHKEFFLSPEDIINIFKKLPSIWDEPITDPSCIPTYFLCSNARKDIKVAFSSDGGDEIFAGYDKYIATLGFSKRFDKYSFLLKTYKKIPFTNAVASKSNKIQKLIEFLDAKSLSSKMDVLSATFTNNNMELLLSMACGCAGEEELIYEEKGLNQLLAHDRYTYLKENILLKIDRASMAVGLEAREPLLDKRLVDYSLSLPDSFKIKGSLGKVILRDILSEILPQKYISQQKKGFAPPYWDWMRGPLHLEVQTLLSKNSIEAYGIFDLDTVRRIYSQFNTGDNSVAKKLWSILTIQNWANTWLREGK